MTLDDLNSANAAAVKRHLRALVDNFRSELPRLLTDLQANAAEYATTLGAVVASEAAEPDDAAIGAWIEAHPREFAAWVAKQERIRGAGAPTTSGLVITSPPTNGPPASNAPAAKPAARRTTARRKDAT